MFTVSVRGKKTPIFYMHIITQMYRSLLHRHVQTTYTFLHSACSELCLFNVKISELNIHEKRNENICMKTPMASDTTEILLLLLLLHLFNGLFSGTTWVRWHQTAKLFWILLEQEMMGWQWHRLHHMQIICTSLQTDNHASMSPSVFTGQMPFLPPNQQRQGTKGIQTLLK